MCIYAHMSSHIRILRSLFPFKPGLEHLTNGGEGMERRKERERDKVRENSVVDTLVTSSNDSQARLSYFPLGPPSPHK